MGKTASGKGLPVKPLIGGVVKTEQTYDFSGLDDWMEETGVGKSVWCIAGYKGAGKTATVLDFQQVYDGDMLCFSYDGKTQKIKNLRHKGNDKIHVYDIRRLFNRGPDERLESGAKAVDMIMGKLSQYEDDELDWVFHDYIDLLPLLTEMKARKKCGKTATQPLSKYDTMWKDRKAFLEDIHQTSLRKSKYGVFYTGYVIRDDIIVDGTTVTTGTRRPKWAGIIEAETDIVVLLDVEETLLKDGTEHHRFAFIDSSKEDYPKNRCWYRLDNTEELRKFVRGEGIEIDRSPPKPITLPEVKSDSDSGKEKGVTSDRKPQKPKPLGV